MYFVGATGFEPATTRPPDVHSTGLSYAPNTVNKGASLSRSGAKVLHFTYIVVESSGKVGKLGDFAYLCTAKHTSIR